MVDANLQRETILPSERAFAYKMKLDAIKHQGERTDLTSAQVGQKSWAVNQVAEQSGDSRVQVQRYIRLTELIPELLDMVDTGQIKFNPAVELSYLASEEQQDFLSAIFRSGVRWTSRNTVPLMMPCEPTMHFLTRREKPWVQ